MKYIIKKTKLLKKKEIEEIKKFLINIYKKEFSDYHTTVYSDPQLELTLLMYDNNKLIGHVSVTKRTIVHNKITYIVGGVGDVAIDETLQNLGFGIHLMEFTNEVLSNNNFDLGVLFCHPKLHNFYTKTNWLKKEKGIISYTNNGLKETEETTYIFPVKINNIQLKDWLEDDIFIGEGSW